MVTRAIIYVDGEPWVGISSQSLEAVGDGNYDAGVDDICPGEDLDRLRTALQSAFDEVYEGHNVEVLFPELSECVDTLEE